MLLMDELNKFRRTSGVVSHSSNPVTLSQELFSSKDGHHQSLEHSDLMMTQPSNPTVNPASLSPELAPVPDTADDKTSLAGEANATSASSSLDLAQHPAAMLYDLPCQRSTELPQSWLASQSPLHPALVFSLQLEALLITSSVILSACRRPLTQIAMSLKTGFCLPPTPSILKTIIWLVTLPPSSRTLTSPTSSTTTRPSQRIRNPAAISATLRLKSLQKILTCSPTLARPLLDATMEALRLVSEGCEIRVAGSPAPMPVTREGGRVASNWLIGAPLPSREVLMALLWALKVEERKMKRGEPIGGLSRPKPGSSIHTPASNNKFILRVVSTKRKLGRERRHENTKRFRLG